MPKPRPRRNSPGAAGKGDVRRPCLVSRAEYEDNWDRAFGKKVVAGPPVADETPRNPPSPSDAFERWWNNPANRPSHKLFFGRTVTPEMVAYLKKWMCRAFRAGILRGSASEAARVVRAPRCLECGGSGRVQTECNGDAEDCDACGGSGVS